MRRPGAALWKTKSSKYFATEYIWHSIKGQKTVGIIEENELEDYVEVAEPVGVVARRHPR